jgi:Fe-S-cluster containining protein
VTPTGRSLPVLRGAEHLAFRCTSCGDCCRRIRVALTHHDLRRLSAGLGRPAASLVQWLAPEDVDMTDEPGSFVRLAAGRRLMVLAHQDGACQLLQADQLCSAYEHRPLDCRVYPFHLERDAAGAPLELTRLDNDRCGDQCPPAELEQLTALDAQRWQELSDFQQRLLRWNQLASHRQRFGKPLGDEAAFLEFLGLGGSPLHDDVRHQDGQASSSSSTLRS